ncbi:endopeptidase La [Aggregatilineales bacterium SYSU G02658]
MSTNEELEKLLAQLIDANGTGEEEEEKPVEANSPRILPVLPLRGLVVFPQTAIPLTVGQARSIKLVDDVVAGDRLVALVTAHNPELERPGPEDVYRVGTLASIHRLFRSADGTIRLLVQGLRRIRIDEFVSDEPYLRGRVVELPEVVQDDIEIEALVRSVHDKFREMAELANNLPGELVNSALSNDDPLEMAYSVATFVRLSLERAQKLLETNDLRGKLVMLLEHLSKEVEVLQIGRRIQSEAQTEMEKTQREYFLREQLKAIQRELNDDGELEEVEEYRQKIEAAGMTEEAHKEALRELSRLEKLNSASAEYGVIRTYLDWIVGLPWNKRTEDNLDIAHARAILNEDHYGLKDVKERILEFLAVRKLRSERHEELQEAFADRVRRERSGAILLFVGPPGVGKTSLGASIARAMGRKFIRMSLGGIRDEAEIRGFRRTYIGAMPGRIIQTLRRAESRNPLIMLDEIDKLGRDYRGDPASALLELLDPEQNAEFRDTYMDVAFDLSEVLFITTANSLETIPGPLLDRMEIIQLSGYTEQEKLAIARDYLVPRQLRENALRKSEVTFEDSALQALIRDYTREAGVRALEREIGRVARKIVTRIAEGTEGAVVVNDAMVRELLGKPRFAHQTELKDRTQTPGVATGLAWTPVGGDVLFVEARYLPGGKGFQYTGHLGEVMQESARIALSCVRSKAKELKIDDDFFNNNEIHLHVPAGATPKDGPSAGVTMAVALTSLLTNQPTRSNVAMTGELTLNGQVLPVGGIKDKVLAAHRLGVDTVILPLRNERDLEDLPAEVREKMKFVLVSHIDEALEVALEPAPKSVRRKRAAKPAL